MVAWRCSTMYIEQDLPVSVGDVIVVLKLESIDSRPLYIAPDTKCKTMSKSKSVSFSAGDSKVVLGTDSIGISNSFTISNF